MPTAWRILRTLHANTPLSGEGAAKVGGRWNSRGTRVVYASTSLSLAALELLVHLNPPVLLEYRAVRIEVDEDQIVELPENQLPEDWRTSPPPPSTRRLGDLWVSNGASAVLSVPSVLIPGERNLLLNPVHPSARRFHVSNPAPFAFDPRLLR